jgi:molybdopterin converting factor small subunit
VAERVGSRELQIEFQPGSCLQDVVENLQVIFPTAFDLVSFTALNEVQTRDMKLPLADNDEIAFMAKYSGG